MTASNAMNHLTSFTVPQSRADITEDEIEAVAQTLRSGWLTSGPAVRKFEKAFSDYLGGKAHTTATNSATLGLTTALKALGIGPGDEVITTTNTFTATALAIYHLGATPVLVDIDHTLCIDPNRIEAAITSRTRAIIPVHLGGLACDMDAIHDIASRKGLLVIEDAAHALPTSWRGEMVGAGRSAATVFSFYATKSITTGEGGMITCPDPALAERMKRLRLHGINSDAFNRLNGNSWLYDVTEDGFKANMTDISASLGLVQLAKLEKMWQRREKVAERYYEGLKGLPLTMPAKPLPNDRHAWHLFMVQLQPEAKIHRNEFISLMAGLGVQCSVHYVPLHRHTLWKRVLDFDIQEFPVAETAFYRSVSLPIFSSMTDSEVNTVIEATRSVLQ